MENTTTEKKAQQMLLNSKIIWAALLLSQFIYVYVVHSMRPQALQTEPQMDHFLFVPLAMTAAVCLLLSYWVPNFLVKANVKSFLRSPGIWATKPYKEYFRPLFYDSYY